MFFPFFSSKEWSLTSSARQPSNHVNLVARWFVKLAADAHEMTSFCFSGSSVRSSVIRNQSIIANHQTIHVGHGMKCCSASWTRDVSERTRMAQRNPVAHNPDVASRAAHATVRAQPETSPIQCHGSTGRPAGIPLPRNDALSPGNLVRVRPSTLG